MSDDVSKKTKHSLYWSIGLKIPYEILRFCVSIITARILDPEDFGIVSIATMVIFYAKSFANIGFNQVLVQRKEITDKHINTVFTVDIIASVVMALLLLSSADYIAGFFHSPESTDVIQVMSIIFILTTFHDLPYVLLRRDLEFRLITTVDMVREILMSVITLTMAVYGYGFWAIVYGHLISLFLASIYLVYRTRVPFRLSYDHNAFKQLLGVSIWSFLQLQIYFISKRIDRIIVGRYFNMNALGLYEKAKSLSQMPSESLGDSLNSVFFSSFSRAQGNKESIDNIFQKGLLVIASVTFPIYFGMFVTANHFVYVLLGEKWSGMIDLFKIMATAGMFASVGGFLSALAVGSGYFKLYTYVYGLSTLVLFFGCMIVAELGIEYVAVVYTLYSCLLMLLTFSIVNIKLGIESIMLFKACVPPLIGSFFMAVIVSLSREYYFSEYTIINFSILLLTGILSYFFIMLLIPSSILNEMRFSIVKDLKKLYRRIV